MINIIMHKYIINLMIMDNILNFTFNSNMFYLIIEIIIIDTIMKIIALINT